MRTIVSIERCFYRFYFVKLMTSQCVAAGYVDLRQEWRCESRITLLETQVVMITVHPVRRQAEAKICKLREIDLSKRSSGAKESVNDKVRQGRVNEAANDGNFGMDVTM